MNCKEYLLGLLDNSSTLSQEGIGLVLERLEALQQDREILLNALERAKHLRETQKMYMANRGNEKLGAAVGRAASILDHAIALASKIK